MKRFGKRFLIFIGLFAFLITGSAGLVSFKDGDEFKIVKNLDIFYNLFRELHLYYVDDTDPQKLVEESIEGMLSNLDPYTSYISPEDKKDFKFQTTGDYGGIGSMIRNAGDFVIISQPYKGFPADKVGLQPGDTIIQIKGDSITGKSIKEVSDLLKGVPGTEVKVTIRRPYVDTALTKTITREEIHVKAVPYSGEIKDNIGYIRLRKFTKDAHKEVEQALTQLKENQNVEKLILDLRNNPGGLLDESVKLCGLFVDKGQTIVETKGKVDEFNKTYTTENKPMDKDIPVVVLVNDHSASASEIVAGAMQDLDRGVVVGQKTHGKGLVQSTRPLSYGAQLKVTTAKYYIPSGRCIQSRDFDTEGKSENIPDSLSKKFKTENGRIVYDQEGIMPDVKVQPEELSKIAASLYSKQFIFNFANYYVAHYDSVSSINSFSVSDSLYQDFKSFIEGKDFDYQTRSEKELNKLIKTAKKEKYYKLAKDQLKALRKKISHDKNKDLRTFKDEIKQLIKEEIISRYYYKAGKLQAQIQDDQQVEKALDVIQTDRYDKILQGPVAANDSTSGAN